MEHKSDRIRHIIGIIFFALLLVWYFSSSPVNPEAVQVKVAGDTYRAPADSTLEVMLPDSSTLRIQYQQSTDSSQEITP